MNTISWYVKTVGDDSTNGVATKAGLTTTTLGRQIERGRLTHETVAAIAVAYGADVLDALVISGLITREQIRDHGVRATLSAASDREIADEVYRRLLDDERHEAFDEPAERGAHLRAVPAVSEANETLAASDADIDAEVEAQQDEP